MQSRISAFLAALFLAALASAPAEAGGKKYFLTLDTFAGNAALEACGKGYHMASLWEILDPTDLKYDTKRGQTREDSGSGPAAEKSGWVRTGRGADVTDFTGSGNCNAWTSNAVVDFGSTMKLDRGWGDPAVRSGPWNAVTATCDSTLPVWCKQN